VRPAAFSTVSRPVERTSICGADLAAPPMRSARREAARRRSVHDPPRYDTSPAGRAAGVRCVDVRDSAIAAPVLPARRRRGRLLPARRRGRVPGGDDHLRPAAPAAPRGGDLTHELPLGSHSPPASFARLVGGGLVAPGAAAGGSSSADLDRARRRSPRRAS
jgi:hypothetical protein